MPAPLFDVFVVGAADGTAAGLPSLTVALAARLGLPAAEVARGLTDRKLRAGHRLDQAAAQAIMKELKALGASALLRPAGTPTQSAATPTQSPAMPAQSPAMVDTLSPLIATPPRQSRDPFGPPPSVGSIDLLTGLPPAHPTNIPDATSGARFAASAASEASLELASPAPARRSATSSAGSSGLNNLRVAASSSASGLAIDSEVIDDAYRVRCGKHGLLYDTRKASGCGKCLAPGRQLSAQLDESQRRFKLANFEDDPVKRAFIGLAVALVVGFIPAAYHALRMGSRDLHQLRAQQEVLSRKPATEEISRQFEELEGDVRNGKGRAQRTTAIVWMLVTGGALVGWYRLT